MDENSLSNCSLNHSPISCPLMASASLDLSFRVFHHLEACFLGFEFPFVFFRVKFALVEQWLAAYECGGLPFVKTDFEAEFLHIHQLLEQRKPLLGFLDNGFQE